ncbi:hypothetical protein BTUL_0004g00580 [Botrytis tulipae]|uniref:2EXR domain-containing protein n=1 Tax=Botrytis tulipae TaxID=87230 RepID=A0A4Z1F970_9HELO|nr:hypothetical protein BTUL_0004g00580 [Botrytis tulipae]
MTKSKNSVTRQPRNSTSLTTFTLFPKLVPELRSMIWELTIFNDPRNIIIGRYLLSGIREGHPRCEEFGYMCTSAVPAVLHICMEARTKGLKYYKLLEWAPECSKGKARLVPVPKHAARTYINWEVDRIVIDHVDDFILGSWRIYHNYQAGKLQNFMKLHDDDRSSAYDLAQKLIENGVKFLAVDTKNDSDLIESFFESIYPWGCPVEQLIFYSSGQKEFASRSHRRGAVRRVLPWSTFRQPKVRNSSKEPTLAHRFLVYRFKVHAEGRGVMLPRDEEIPQTAGQEMPKFITPMGFGGQNMKTHLNMTATMLAILPPTGTLITTKTGASLEL